MDSDAVALIKKVILSMTRKLVNAYFEWIFE